MLPFVFCGCADRGRMGGKVCRGVQHRCPQLRNLTSCTRADPNSPWE